MFGFNSVMKTLLTITCLLLGVGNLLAGKLEFETTAKTMPSEPGDDTVSVNFPYVNTTDGDVEIVRFDSNCSACLSAGPKRKLKPGEAGVVEAVFKVGSYTGSIKKTLKVTMRDAKGQLHTETLQLTVLVPVLVQIGPNKIQWQAGGALETKTVDVKIPWENPIHVTGVQSTRSNFKISVETVDVGRHYRVHVTPTDLETAQMGLIKVSTDCEFKKFRDHMLFVSVVK